MKDAIEKTNSLVRTMVPVDLLEANPHNPNKMDMDSFNLLVDNIEKMGVTDPVLVVPHPSKEGMYRIIGGEHRWEACKLLGFEEVPITLVSDPEFTEDAQKFQIVRHNIIHGKMSAKKFTELYQSLADDYSDEVASLMFGFTDEEEFKRLLKATRDDLPKELKPEFDKAKKEIKTVEDLAKVLNHLFSTYGDTLKYGYMITDFGGKESIWMRLRVQDRQNFLALCEKCRDKSVTVDSVMSHIYRMLAYGVHDSILKDALELATPVELAEGQLPLEDYSSVI